LRGLGGCEADYIGNIYGLCGSAAVMGRWPKFSSPRAQ
jgi:hypothetical protein